MNKHEAYEAWAPAESVWTPWTKPVLFAHMEAARTDVPVGPPVGQTFLSAIENLPESVSVPFANAPRTPAGTCSGTRRLAARASRCAGPMAPGA